MTTIYRKLKDVLVKPIIYSGLAALTLTACTYRKTLQKDYKDPFVFDSFGIVYEEPHQASGHTSWGVAVGDMDGDGDLDIIVADRWHNNIKIFENKILQKGIKNQ